MNIMKVVSLFDGISCGMQALKELDIKVDEYHAFEIDKYAIEISKKNHPEIIHHGNVIDMPMNGFEDVDLFLAGFPCQSFSIAGNRKGFFDDRGNLFHVMATLLKAIKPKHFLLENVRMSKANLDIINAHVGVEPVIINSALLSAQNRVRSYWCNFEVEQPEDAKIYLKDILEEGCTDRLKNYCIDTSYYKGGNIKSYFEKHRRQLVFDKPERITKYGNGGQAQRIYNTAGKSVTLSANGGGQGAKTGLYYTKQGVRKLTPVECERLQGLPDGYTEGVSDTQRYKCIGNGWTVPVIKHILQQIL